MNDVTRKSQSASLEQLDPARVASPIRSLFIVMTAIVGAEWLVMLVLNRLNLDYTQPVLDVIDGLMLAVLVSPVLYMAFVVPIRKLIKYLQQSVEIAEASNNAKSLFLSTMNHEMRTPLNGIIGLTDMLKDKQRSDHDDIVDNIAMSSELLLNLINDLLDFSKINTGSLSIEKEKFDLVKLLKSVQGISYGVARDKNVDVTVFIDKAIPREVIGDETRLQQILLNTINNAVKFSSQQKRRGRVSFKVLCRSRKGDKTILKFIIADNGIGISRQKIDNIFDPFVQAEKGISRNYGGMGLGLAIVKYLTEAMGGDIDVRSGLGTGSTFTLQIPFKVISEQAADPATTDSVETKADLPGTEQAEQKPVGNTKATPATDKAPVNSGEDIAVHAIAGTAEVLKEEMTASVVNNHEQPNSDQNYRRKMVSGGNIITDPEARPEGRKNILIADDNEINRKVIVHQLSSVNAHTDVASDGEEALRLWSENKYDLIMTDLHMPVMDGYKLTESIRASDPSKHNTQIPIVAITADNSADVKVRCLTSGMDDYLVKPINNDALQTTLEKWAPEKQVSISGGKQPVKVSKQGNEKEGHLLLSNLVDLVGDDPVVIKEFIDDYHSSLVRTVKDITRSAKAGRFLEVKELMHKLKSSSRAVGACVLGDMCEKIEKKITTNSNPGINELIHEFATEVVSVIDQIKSMKAEHLRF